MKNNIYILLAFLGVMGFFASCEKEGEEVKMLANPVAPEIAVLPNLTLERTKGTETLTFDLTPVKPGFEASAQYFLEVSNTETFEKVEQIQSGVSGEEMQITVSDLNQVLLKLFTEDATSTAYFRLRSVLVVDGGQGAPGTGTEPFEYVSTTKTADITIYGLLRLDLSAEAVSTKIVSPLGNGIYNGLAKLGTSPITLTNPETGKVYGGSGGVLTENGAGITIDPAGWHMLTANINDMTYTADPYMVGIIGSATPTGWDSDTDMEYDPVTSRWSITIDLVGGQVIKFRMNDGWAWNMGLAEGDEGGLTGNLMQGGVGNDIPVAEDGNYTVYFTILSDDAGTYEMVKN